MTGKLYGWKGRILRVNLSTGKVSKQDLPKEWMRDYVGCRGINARILFGEIEPGIDSFGPENKLIFGTGPLEGTPIGMGRVSITTRSDRGCVAEGGFGGFWGPELKYAGYDHVVVEGVSDRPCYIWIDDDNVEIRSAEHLWGKDTFETDRTIKEEVGDFNIQVAYIGPAGENLVHNSLVLTDLCRGGGRSGCGEVMGSKKLKAIAVRGTGGVQIADPEEYRKIWSQIFQAHDHYHTDDHYVPIYSVWGSCGMTRMFSFTGSLQTRNAQEGEFNRIDDVCAEKYFEKYAIRGTSCFCCPYAAEGKWHEVRDGEYAGTKGKNMWAGGNFAFTALIGNSNLAAAIKLVDECNRLGMDQFFVAYSIAWAMECYEKGILTKQDTDGLELNFGNHRAAVELAEKIAYRKGFGGILALGVEKASQKIGRGSDRYKLTVKGLELEMMPWRNLYQAALGNATSETGPDHTKWYPPYPSNPRVATPELLKELGLDLDLKSVFNTRIPDGKARFMKFRYDSTTFIECLPSCVYMIRGRLGIDFRPWVRILNATTGLDFTLKEAFEVGARVVTLERSFNVREGYRREHDVAPRRMREEPLGAQFYEPLTQDKLDIMLDEYYELQGWDRETSIPTLRRLKELRLEYVAEDLKKNGLEVK